MRRFFAGAAFMALAAAVPINALGGDREIATEIIKSLKTQRDAGALKGFTLDLKVENGNVLFLGEVANNKQQQLVLQAANGVEGVKNVVNQLTVQNQPASATEAVAKAKPAAKPAATQVAKTPAPGNFSLKQALRKYAPGQSAPSGLSMPPALQPQVAATATPSPIAQVAASSEKSPSDAQLTTAIESELQTAMKAGKLKGFGVAIDCENGNIWLKGRAASSAQKEMILQMVRGVEGVRNVVDNIAITAQQPATAPALPTPPQPVKTVSNERELPHPPSMNHPVAKTAEAAPRHLKPVAVRDVPVEPVSNSPAALVRPAQSPYAAAPAPYRQAPGGPQGIQARPAGMPMHGAPGMAAAPAAYPATVGVGHAAPRYEQPYMPNYAWPGYAAYPNYAAVTYPQQYSPSAWPYIGPFYPYPQVPLGWRKVSLEWDDGWWYLDFTDK